MDNFFKGCPAKMDDHGRFLSNFKNDTLYNEEIRYLNGIYRDDEYRLFLQINGNKIITDEFNYYKNKYANHCNGKYLVHMYPTSPTSLDFINERLVYDNYMKTGIAFPRPDFKDFVLNPNC